MWYLVKLDLSKVEAKVASGRREVRRAATSGYQRRDDEVGDSNEAVKSILVLRDQNVDCYWRAGVQLI